VLKRELFKAWLAGFGHVFLIAIQTYNLISMNFLIAGVTSVLITICWINGVHAVLKTRAHKIVYGIGAVSGVEMAMVVHRWVV
jgi:hypothetical protein